MCGSRRCWCCYGKMFVSRGSPLFAGLSLLLAADFGRGLDTGREGVTLPTMITLRGTLLGSRFGLLSIKTHHRKPQGTHTRTYTHRHSAGPLLL
uniref:Putative secreted protein n=1 Tax=Anopheles triannulatus TaxID=58253 RepID=A0A2M4B2S6_9DIPT